MNIVLLLPLNISQKFASVEPMLNMALNKPEEDTLEEVSSTPQPSSPAENTPWNTPPPMSMWQTCLRKYKMWNLKLSSLTLTKLDLLSFLEDITTELKLLKHKLQLPYLGHKFSITTLPVDQIAVMMKSQTWCLLMKVNHLKTMTMCQYHLDHTYLQKLSAWNLLKTKNFSLQTFQILFNTKYLHITHIYLYLIIH